MIQIIYKQRILIQLSFFLDMCIKIITLPTT